MSMHRFAFALGLLCAAAPLAHAGYGPKVLEDCASHESYPTPPEADAPDLAAKAQLYVSFDSDDYSAADRAKITAAVTAKLKKLKMPLVSAADLADAAKLVAASRHTPTGPVCGLPPGMIELLAAKTHNLIVAKIDVAPDNDAPGTPPLILSVWFERAGSTSRDGVPEALDAVTAGPKVTDLVKAASKLVAATHNSGGEEGGVAGGEPQVWYETSGTSVADPWLRAPIATYSTALKKRLESCVDAQASYEATLSLDEGGKTTSVELKPVTAAPAKSKTDACVRDTLKTAAFACPHDGKATQINFRVCVAPMKR